MKIEDLMIDPVAREEGGWVTNMPEFPGLELKVRGSGNKAWASLQKKLTDAIPRQRRLNGIEPEEWKRILRILLLETSLLDWRGIENGNGEAVPYSKEQATKYLTDPRYDRFVDACVFAATYVAEQAQAEIEDDAKN